MFKPASFGAISALVHSALLVCVLFIVSIGHAFAQQKTVSVLAVEPDSQVDAERGSVREGLREALRTGGFQESKNFRFQYETVPVEAGAVSQAMHKLSRMKPDVLVVIAPEQLFPDLAIPSQPPVVLVKMLGRDHNRVTDGAQAANSPAVTNFTSVTNGLAVSRQVALVRQLVPGARKVGVIYNPNNPQSVTRVKELQEIFTQNGLSMIEAGAQRAADVGSAARSLISRVDAFYTFADPNVQQSFGALVKVANDAKIPLFGFDAENVRQGALAALMVTDRDLGIQAGRMAVKILRGAKPQIISPETAVRPQLFLNTVSAGKQGVNFSESLLKSAGEIFNNEFQERSGHDRSRR